MADAVCRLPRERVMLRADLTLDPPHRRKAIMAHRHPAPVLQSKTACGCLFGRTILPMFVNDILLI